MGAAEIQFLSVTQLSTINYQPSTFPSCFLFLLHPFFSFCYFPRFDGIPRRTRAPQYRRAPDAVWLESSLTNDARRYVKDLRVRFGLPVFYQHLDTDGGTLGPLE